MNAGVFPKSESTGRLFTEGERAWIGQRDVALSRPELRWKEEALYFSLAAEAAGEDLLLSVRAAGDAERDKGTESIFVKRCLSLFPKLKMEEFRSDRALPRSRRDAFRVLLTHLGEPGIEETPYYRYFAGEPESAGLLRAAAGQSFCRDGVLLREMPYEGQDPVMSYSGIEEYLKCHFKFFANRLLKAKEDPSGDLGGSSVGTFIHSLLELLLRGAEEEGKTLGDLSEEEVRARSEKITRDLFTAWFGEEIAPELKYQLDLVVRDAFAIVKILWKESQITSFTPVLFEQNLSDLPESYRIELPDGRKLVLSGIIDRVDRYRAADGTDYVRVVDYKTGSHDFDLKEVASGLNLQMLLYLFALWGKPVPLRNETITPQPAGVLYVNGKLKEEKRIEDRERVLVQTEDILPLQRAGLFVNDPELLAAQDPEGEGRFIPVWYKKKKDSLNLVTAKQLGSLKKKVEKDIAVLVRDLCAGRIEAKRLAKNPRDPRGDTCTWCPYMALCKRDDAAWRGYTPVNGPEDIFGKEEDA